MSRTNEMAELIIKWYSSLDETHCNYPIHRAEALKAIEGLDPVLAIESIAMYNSTALELITDDPNYLAVEYSNDGRFTVSEMVWQPENPRAGMGEHYNRIQTVEVESALDALINLKQRFEYQLSNSLVI